MSRRRLESDGFSSATSGGGSISEASFTEMEEDVIKFFCMVLGTGVFNRDVSMHANLKSGITLCRLVNELLRRSKFSGKVIGGFMVY